MKRHLILFFISLLPLLAMSQGVITRSVKKPQPQKQASISKPTGSINEHGYVDLGLSVKWATCNVGASSPSEDGDRYAWGETTTKSEYTEANCKTFKKDIGNIEGNPLYDVARAKWGGTWRLPTLKEIDELIEKCTWKWIKQNGRNGYRVISKKNGKSIFLPATGFREKSLIKDINEYGCYWSSTSDMRFTDHAYSLFTEALGRNHTSSTRDKGYSVRPVTE